MEHRSNTHRVSLAKDRSLSLTAARGASVRCRDGNLWITQDCDSRDVVLAPGQSFTFDRDGPAMVSAFVGSSVELQAARRSALAVRVH